MMSVPLGQEIMVEHPGDERREDSTMEVLLEELEAELPPTKSHAAAPACPPTAPTAPTEPTEPTSAEDPGYASQARAMVEWLEAELPDAKAPERQAALHYEIARLCEYPLGDPRLALRHFTRSRELAPDHIPTLRGERRARLATKGFRDAVSLLDQEARLTPEPRQKAALYRERAQLLADVLGQPEQAEQALTMALELDPGDLATLRGLTRRARDSQRFGEVSRLLGEQARAAGQDDGLRAALLVQRAQVCEEERKDPAAAVEFYEAALTLRPDSAIALEALTRLYDDLRRPRDATRILRARGERLTDPAQRSATLFRVARLSARSAEREALTALDEAAAEGDAEGLVHEMRARLLERANRFDEAAAAWTQRIESLQEPLTKARLMLGLARIEADALHLPDEATVHLEQALALDPTSAAVADRLEAAYVAQGRWAELASLLGSRAAKAHDPAQRSNLELRAAEIYDDRLNDKKSAVDRARSALAACGERGADAAIHRDAAFELLARLLAESARHEELLALHRDAVEVAPSDAHAILHLFTMGQLYEDTLGRPEEAVHTYRRVLRLAPGDTRAIIAMRRSAARAHAPRDLLEALELEADLSTDVTQAVALTLRAGSVLLDSLDSPVEAIARFRKARDLDGSCLTVLRALQRAYRATGRYEELLEVLRRQVELAASPLDAADIELEIGAIHRDRLGRQDDATAAFERARELAPTHAAALAALTQQARARGDHDAFAEALEQAAEACAEPRRRAELFLELGEEREDNLDDLPAARSAYSQASQAAQSAIAQQALARVCARLGEPPEPLSDAPPDVRTEAALRLARQLAAKPGEEKHAVEVMNQALADDPSSADLLLRKAELTRRLGDLPALEQTLAGLSRCLTDVEGRVAALRELAEIQLRRGGDGEAARATWEALWSLRPGDPEAAEALTRLVLAASDEALMARTLQRLGTALPPALAAEASLRLGELAEARSDLPNAMAQLRRALEMDALSVGAARGCYRVARKLGSAPEQAWTARRLAQQLEGEAGAAELWLTSARIRADELGDVADAETDVARALALTPDSKLAADSAIRWLRGRPERLVELLQQAAVTATQSERRCELWLAVGRTQAEVLGDTAAALSTMGRALGEGPERVETLAALADLEQQAGRHGDAARRWAKVVERSQDAPGLIHAHLRLAALYGDQLADGKRARLSLQAVMALDPSSREGLERLARLEQVEGRPAEAATVLEQLVGALDDQPQTQATAWIALARARGELGDGPGSVDALLAAIAIAGPHGEGMREVSGAEQRPELMVRVVDALRTWTAAQRSPVEMAHGCLASARLLSADLHDPARALAVLRAGIEETDGALSLELAYAQTALEAGLHDDAIESFAKVLEQSPARADAHRGLSRAFAERGDTEAARLSAQAVALLTGAEPAAAVVTPAPTPRPGSFGGDLMEQLGRLDPAETAALDLLRALSPALAKVHTPNLEAFGLVPRDRMTTRGGDSLRVEADAIAETVSAGPFDLYVHRLRGRGVVLELGPTPALMIPATLRELPAARRRFELAVPLIALARGMGSIEGLTPRELEVLLASAARFVEPAFGKGLTSEEVLDGERRRLYKALPRRTRKPAEEAAQAYVEAGRVDIDRLYRRSRRTAYRVAALLAGDLVVVTQALVEAHPEWSQLDAEALVHDAAPVRDLVVFWTSPAALHLRAHAGLSGATAPTEATP